MGEKYTFDRGVGGSDLVVELKYLGSRRETRGRNTLIN